MPTVAENINEVVNNDKQFYVIEANASGMATLLGTIDADTGAIKTAVELIDNAIDGTEMQVDVKTITAGTNNIGKVSTDGITITQTPTVDTNAYTAGDTVGGLLTFANAAQVSGGGGVIKNVMIIDDGGMDEEFELWLFDTTYTPPADDAAWAPTEADLHTLVAVISTEDSAQGWMAAGTPSICDIEVARRYDCTGTSLFGSLVAREASNPTAADDITIRIMLLQD